MKLSGRVFDKDGNAMSGVSVELKNDRFETVFQAFSDDNGRYELHAEEKRYDFLTAVKDYGTKYLEFWAQNLDLANDISLDICVDRLEIYGLHVFSVKGAYPSLMVYFRPMSLRKFQAGESDIAPNGMRVKIFIDGQLTEIYALNDVQEFIGDRMLSAYLAQVSLPQDASDWEMLTVDIEDQSGERGRAIVFHN